MFFTEQEKAIYTSPLDGRKYDPLRVDRNLTIVTQNRLDEYVGYRNNADATTGDVSQAGRTQAAVLAAQAELELAKAARVVFELADFPDVTDARALEVLYNFLGYLEGKVETAGTPQSTPQTVDGSNLEPTTSS